MPPVKIAVLILTPKDDPGLHLQVLSALAKDFAESENIDRVAGLEDAAAILDYFTTGELKLPSFRSRPRFDESQTNNSTGKRYFTQSYRNLCA